MMCKANAIPSYYQQFAVVIIALSASNLGGNRVSQSARANSFEYE